MHADALTEGIGSPFKRQLLAAGKDDCATVQVFATGVSEVHLVSKHHFEYLEVPVAIDATSRFLEKASAPRSKVWETFYLLQYWC